MSRIALKSYIYYFFRLVRFNNLLIIAFTQYALKIFLIDESLDIWATLQSKSLFLLSCSTMLIAAAGYIINDYYDIKIDSINKPKEVIVGKVLRRRIALALNFLFNIIALFIAFWLKLEVGILTFFCGFFLWFYSNQLKRLALIGNVTIALLTSMAIIVVSLYYPQNSSLVYVFALFAFFISLIREIIKDMEDVKGDKTFGCKTLPILWGIRRTKVVIYTFFSIFIIILLSTYLTFPNYFALYLYLVVLPPLAWFFIKLKQADTKRDFRYLSKLCKAIMVLGILSMALV